MLRLTLSLLALLAPASLAAQQPSSAAGIDPRAEALIERWVEASGGPKIWDGVRDIRYTVTTVWYDSTGAERRRRPRYAWVKKTPDGFRVRVERTEPEGRYVQVWDGERAWGTLDGRMLADTMRAVTEIPYVAGDLSYWIGLPWKLRDPGVRLQHLSSEANAPGEVVAVSFGDGIGLHDGDRYWYYFADGASPFPTQVHYVEEGKTVRDMSIWSDWKRQGPSTYVGSRLFVDARGRPTKELLFSDIVVNEGIPDRLFRP